ncbi:MAG: hypothetical protein CM1200mP1_11810 [Candidatus Neomarinimicrobiota bacterium]|nr:MAG: hypothetical protein CM1200mP1_11810 [Candidatus Neomarinimicrobiota bacterium]
MLSMVKKLLVLLSFSIVISQTYSLNEAVQVALENKETLKASVMDLQTSKQNVKNLIVLFYRL